ncbi:uncharacterized protein [Temnothorax nylanderi]|uniref:uncharacterized protein n=1 Tax=Temnothorax nylanderi TaxID=102681 RepID=UPI003A8AEB8F
MRFYVLLVNVVAAAVTMISVAITSEKVNRGLDQIERPLRVDSIVSPQNRNVEPFTDSSSIFFLHLLKYKPRYQKLDKIPTTTAAAVTRACICVPFYLCDSNQTIITDGSGVIDERAGICPGELDVCCYPRKATPMPTTPPTTPPIVTFPTTPPIVTFPTTPPTVTFPTTPPTVTFPNPPTTVLPNCICVVTSLCDPNGIVTIPGEGIINPRYGLCPGNLVCCRILVTTTQPPTNPPTTMTTVPPTVATSAPPGQTQLCFVCGNVTQCFTCVTVITPGGGGMIDPRFSQILSDGNVCAAMSIPSCQNTASDTPITNLGPLKNAGTSQECYCVKTWLCSEGNTVSLDGLGIIDSRFTACSSADQVCCRLAGIDLQGLRNADTTLVSSSRSPVANIPSNRSSSQIACGIRDNSYAPPQPFPPNSEKTYFAEFPWMVALLLKSATGSPYVFHCGASVISNGAVLTAAHCVVNQKPENLIARFGQWNLGNNTQPLPTQDAQIFTIVVHPSYYSGGLFHDVAVLVLAEPVTYSANVLPICLPEQGMVFLTGTRCYGIGWGSDSFGPEGQYHAELRKVSLPIIDQGDCQTRLRSTKLGQYFELHGSFICAGGETNRDTCRGDGGGPLICQAATGQFFQAGIVSWGIGCGASNVPAVYASVSQHSQWIDQQFATYGV